MFWEIEITPLPQFSDTRGIDIAADAVDLGLAQPNSNVAVRSSRGYILDGDFDLTAAEMVSRELLSDIVVEQFRVTPIVDDPQKNTGDTETTVYVLPKPGVTDSVAENTQKAIREFSLETRSVRTFRKYRIRGLDETGVQRLCGKLLANDAVEHVFYGKLTSAAVQLGAPYSFRLVTVPIRDMTDDELVTLSRTGQLYLSLVEMKTIQSHFQTRGNDPTDVELETIAQTWSEHCSHKTLAGRIEYHGPDGVRHFDNMLKETIFAATVKIREKLGKDDFCVSVFADNAGIVRFDEEMNVCFKVETHNHPSALEPYGGANTGLGGVIRDTMGTGMGAKPIANTDVFCFAPPDMPLDEIPAGTLHPRRVIKGVVSGVRDYGNRMGIPTVNGAVYFDKRYLGNPLVYCGSIGIIPHEMSFKEVKAGDLIVALGGRTGRDGIHGATFSSAELTHESETVSGGAVQIGNAITEKMVLDVQLQARDLGLYHAVTDCGAGGFSSAVGEMGENIGATVYLDKIPLKYEGLSYTEMWISEAQERMVFAVPPEKWESFRTLCEGEHVEATVLGTFEPTGQLQLFFHGQQVADLPMRFLHKGRPPVIRKAVYQIPLCNNPLCDLCVSVVNDKNNSTDTLLKILSSLNVASKHWIIRQYDHEVQAGSVIKPLVGVTEDGPGDAAVIRPRLGRQKGIAISCGMNPHFGDFDTYWMAASAIDEAVRNCVAVGADPARISILDNFCWGNTDRPETLGSLVRAAIGCYDTAIAFGTPFISGKDSLNNEFLPEGATERISIPPSLLISAMGMVDDIATCVTMDAKESGNFVFLIGETKPEFGGSHYSLVTGMAAGNHGGDSPKVDFAMAKRTFQAVYESIQSGHVRACHDLSEGGLAVALAEMAFAGGLGGTFRLPPVNHPLTKDTDTGNNGDRGIRCNGGDNDDDSITMLFSESNSRFLCEVKPEFADDFVKRFRGNGISCVRLGTWEPTDKLQIAATDGRILIDTTLIAMKTAWQKPLDW